MVELQELFDVCYGVNLELNKLVQSDNGINFVSRTSKNNGVSAKVQKLNDIEPIPAGVLTVAGGGSVLETFLQTEPFYSGRDLYYLRPKIHLSDAQKLFYCVCIKANQYKYSYGRQANRTLKNLLVPSIDEIPSWVNNSDIELYNGVNRPKHDSECTLPIIKNYISLGELFTVKNGIAATNIKEFSEPFENSVLFIRPASTFSRTLRSYIDPSSVDSEDIYPAGTLFVSTNGEGSHSYSYVSTDKFVPNSDVSVLIPLKKMPLELKLYYSKCISANRYLFSYGRKPKGDKLKNIKLPYFNANDFELISNFINSLPYSSVIDS
ncbi:restriction endonuclease subunit S [Klebsiella sp. GB_Kp059]|uniref:restriction endonuclease subunit S n=1 Tax=Klebsiella sp. GB_Kp059 TaxID=3153407 RepID=UPI0027EFB1EF|nr:restriction endonuclease subunit S [Klebsiella michiganensis]